MRTFVDDAGIAHAAEDNVVGDLRRFLTRTREFKLKLKPQKTYIGFARLEFLGHELSRDGLGVLKSKIEAVVNFGVPTTKQ